MSKIRIYEFEYNLPDEHDTPCLIMANISGHDTPWSASSLDPPEYREVEIQVLVPATKMYYNSTPEGPGFIDMTDQVSEEFLDEMRDKALMMEDDKLAAQEEDRF